MNRNTKIGLGLGGGCLGLFVLFIFITYLAGWGKIEKVEDKQPLPTQITSDSTQSQPSKEESSKISYIFDVPSLVGKNIDEIRNILGDPVDEEKNLAEPSKEQKDLGVSEWDNTFRKDSAELLITFNSDTRKIIDFFISGTDKGKLLEIGNLKEDANNYKLELVKAIKDPTQITGVKIIPK